MDETYQTYVNRVAGLSLPGKYGSQLQNIQESPKFKSHTEGKTEPAPFPGYSVITPPWGEESENTEFYSNLKAFQQQLLQQLNQGLLLPVPPESFHLTLADLIWEEAYREVVRKNPEFEEQLRWHIAESFQQYQQFADKSSPVQWQLLGLMIRPRALNVCLVPKDEASYQQILQLRRSIYQNANLIELGIEQQYHFTAHITLGYFGKISPDLDRANLAKTLAALDQHWLETEPQVLKIHRAELRKFEDMTRFEREPHWPMLEF